MQFVQLARENSLCWWRKRCKTTLHSVQLALGTHLPCYVLCQCDLSVTSLWPFCSLLCIWVGDSSYGLCNSPEGALYAGKGSTAMQPSVPEISCGTDRKTNTLQVLIILIFGQVLRAVYSLFMDLTEAVFMLPKTNYRIVPVHKIMSQLHRINNIKAISCHLKHDLWHE